MDVDFSVNILYISNDISFSETPWIKQVCKRKKNWLVNTGEQILFQFINLEWFWVEGIIIISRAFILR